LPNSGTVTTLGVSNSAANPFVHGLFIMQGSNAGLAFNNASNQNIVLAPNAPATSINSLLAVTDKNGGLILTWTVAVSPLHGTLVTGGTQTSTGGSVTPSGFTYQPDPGYGGTDGFTIFASDGVNTAATTAAVTLTVNRAPVANPVAVTRNPGTVISIPVATILAQTSDPDAGDNVSLIGVGNGMHGTAVVNGSVVMYTPNAGSTFADSFSYTVQDNHGAQANSVVNVTLTPGITSFTAQAGGAVAFSFCGIPGYTYGVQYTPTLSPSVVWTTVLNLTADASGQGLGAYSPPIVRGTGFYRLIYPAPAVGSSGP